MLGVHSKMHKRHTALLVKDANNCMLEIQTHNTAMTLQWCVCVRASMCVRESEREIERESLYAHSWYECSMHSHSLLNLDPSVVPQVPFLACHCHCSVQHSALHTVHPGISTAGRGETSQGTCYDHHRYCMYFNFFVTPCVANFSSFVVIRGIMNKWPRVMKM